MKTWQMVFAALTVGGCFCQAATTEIDDDFDTGSLESWTASGGAALYIYASGTDYSTSTPNAANLPKNGGTIQLTAPLPLATKAYTNITIRFNYKWLNGSTTRFLNVDYAPDGVTYTKLAQLSSGNEASQPASITLRKDSTHLVSNMTIQNSAYVASFTDNAKFRFQNVASATADVRVYIDNILITALPEWIPPPPAGTVFIIR